VLRQRYDSVDIGIIQIKSQFTDCVQWVCDGNSSLARRKGI